MSMLQQIEERCGPYVLASDILVFLRSISEEQFQGRLAAKNRAYGLASELLIKSTYVQLEAIEREGRVLGPAVFQGYCAEILDALFARSNARRGVEALLTLMDWLLAKSVEQTENAPLYLELAEQAINTTVDLSSIKAEEEERKERASIRAMRTANELDPYVQRYVPSIGLATITYLRDIQRKVHALKPDFERQFRKSRIAAKRTDGKADDVATLEIVSALQSLLRISANIEHYFLSGLLSERLGALCERAERGTGLKLVKSAASYFELLGDKEGALSLTTVARDRYRRAGYLYGVAKDAGGIERIRAKASASPAQG
jgi:hypothetical protein